MSLTLAAQHLASKGRGPDTELVHMTKGEIKGLRQLAMAQGGDLSINPYTGLVEAGFLSKILPMVAMAAATYFTAGAATPMFASALSGTALAGSSGLLAGAASGALIGGLGAGLQGGNVGKGALFGGIGGAITGGMGGYESAPNVFSGMGDTSNALVQSGAQAGNVAATTGSTLEAANQAIGQGAAGSGGFTPTDPFLNSVPPGGMPPGATPPVPSPADAAKQALVGESYAVPRNPALGYAGTEQGIVNPSVMPQPPGAAPTDSYYKGLGTGMLDTAKKAAILGAPGILAQGYGMTPEQEALPTGEEPSTLDRISPNFRAQEPVQPNPYYQAQYPDYKLRPYGMAGGGAVAFSNRGIVQPLPRSSGADPGIYSDTDPNTARLDAYNAALYRLNKARTKAGIKQPAEIKKAAVLGDVEEAAEGGIMQAYQAGGPVERMSMMNTAMNPQGGLYPQGMIDKTQYATPTQRPVSAEMVSEAPAYERSSPMLMARGGIADLGGYSDGGRMLKGPGDGMSDSIPATIGRRQPARLADGEFVVPADVVSHLGNGSTDAGARKLYSMMDKIRKARTGKKKQAPAVKTDKYLPA
jgi:hypothetical protein